MKKWIAMLLCLMVMFAFTACGGEGDAAGSTGSEDGASAETAEESNFEEIVLFDNDQCKMVVKDFDADADWGPELKVYLENKTSDRTLMFSVEDASVNGFMMDPLFATEIAAGKKENTEIYWTPESLEENDIEKIEEIDLQMRVYDSDDYDSDPFVEDTFTITIPQ